MTAVVLQRNLHTHRKAEASRLFDARPCDHGVESAAVVVERQAGESARHRAPPMAAVMPADDPVAGSEIAHHVFPGETVAADPVAADERGSAPAHGGPIDPGAVLTLGESFFSAVERDRHAGRVTSFPLRASAWPTIIGGRCRTPINTPTRTYSPSRADRSGRGKRASLR